MTTLGVSAVRFTESEGADKGRYDKAKVKRYWAGSKPYWERREEEEE